jgi:hypothetical protein
MKTEQLSHSTAQRSTNPNAITDDYLKAVEMSINKQQTDE